MGNEDEVDDILSGKSSDSSDESSGGLSKGWQLGMVFKTTALAIHYPLISDNMYRTIGTLRASCDPRSNVAAFEGQDG